MASRSRADRAGAALSAQRWGTWPGGSLPTCQTTLGRRSPQMSVGCDLAVVSRRKVPRGTDHAGRRHRPDPSAACLPGPHLKCPAAGVAEGHHKVTSSLACEARPGLDTGWGQQGVWGAAGGVGGIHHSLTANCTLRRPRRWNGNGEQKFCEFVHVRGEAQHT